MAMAQTYPRRRKRQLPDVTSQARSRSAQRMPQRIGTGMEGPLVSQQRRRMPRGNAYGLRRNLGMPTLGGGPGPNVKPMPAQESPHVIPGGGYPGPQGVGNPNRRGNPIAPLGADWGWRNLTPAQRRRRRLEGPGGRPNPGGRPGPIGGGPGPNVGPGQGGGGGQQPPGGEPGPVTEADLPLDPTYMAQRRLLEDAYMAQQAGFEPMRANIAAQDALARARMTTNEDIDRRALIEALNERGALGGSIESTDRGRLATDYLRQAQDLASATGGAYTDLARSQSESGLTYAQQLADLLAQSAARSAADPYAVANQGGGGGGGNRRRRRRNRGRR